MGRKNADIAPFFKEALATSKYINLKLVKNAINTGVLYFPRMSPTLGQGCQCILKDWENLKKRDYIYSTNYSLARQRMQSAIRQSDFLEFISSEGGNIIFRLLERGEVLDKKMKKKMKQKSPIKIKRKEEEDLNTMDHSPSSSSGYSSGEGSPANCGVNKENGHAPLPTPTTQLDRNFMATGNEVFGTLIQKVERHVEIESPPLRNDAPNLMDKENPEEVSLDELYKIEYFVVTDTEKHQEIMQKYMESINSMENTDEAAWLSKLLSETVNYEAKMKQPMESTSTVENTREIDGPSNFVPDTASCERRMHTPQQQQLPNNLESTKTVENTAGDIVFPSNFDASMRLDEATTEPVSKCPVEDLQLLPNNNSKINCLKCWEKIQCMISPNTGCLNLCTGFVHP